MKASAYSVLPRPDPPNSSVHNCLRVSCYHAPMKLLLFGFLNISLAIYLASSGPVVQNDFVMSAKKVAENLDADTRELLRAYCDGVNDYIAANPRKLHPLFDKLGVKPERWTVADCIASWWHMGQFFATDGTRDLIRYRNLAEGGPRRGAAMRGRRGGRGARGRGGAARTRPAVELKPLGPDDAAAVVARSDVSDEWVRKVNEFARKHGIGAKKPPAAEGPKFSHAWVVGGKRTSTGSAVLVSDPQTQVRNPSLFYEFHIKGKTFDARGIGVPGSPGILIGFTDKVAWGLSALGADQADLFRLKTDPAHPDQYFFDGEWRKMKVTRETIKVRGGRDVKLTVRTTHLGPVVTRFAFARKDEGEVALKRIPICETDRETIQGILGMIRASDADEFAAALPGWRFPSANIVFGDRAGKIGYWALVAVPIRSRHALQAGGAAHDGTESKYDWKGIVPYELLPHVLNPAAGLLFTANHRSIGSYYPIPLGAMTGGGGDTGRSWRLRQRLTAKKILTPRDVLDVHFDSVNPVRREMIRVGLHLRDALHRELSSDATSALEVLDGWYKSGASSDLSVEGAALAGELRTFFRFSVTDLTQVYGGGGSGLSYFLKSIAARIDKDPKADVSALEQEYIDWALSGAWGSAKSKYGRDASKWSERARGRVKRRKMGYFAGLDGFPSIDPSGDLAFPALTCVDTGTIKSQSGQSYTQFVPMHDVDEAMSILPIGQSELPGSPFRTSTMKLWEEGRLHPAPLSYAAVQKYAKSRTVLSK